jgi:hypothetical protein
MKLDGGTKAAVSCVALLLAMACGSSTKNAEPPPAAYVGHAGDAGAPTPAASAAPAERPFAKNPVEATTMIQDVIQTKIKTLWKCVDTWRISKGDPHASVVVNIGIDQEGTLVGVASLSSKNELDPALRECLYATLRGAPFPRSRAGVITVKQSFEDTAVYR